MSNQGHAEPVNKRLITHEGQIDVGGFKLSCFVLEDETRVISGREMQRALRMVDEDEEAAQTAGTRLSRYLNQKTLKPFIYKDKNEGHYNPIACFKGDAKINGYEATVLVDICDAFMQARKSITLSPRQAIIAEQCELIIRSFAKLGIVALIDEATGYQEIRRKDALQEYLNKILSKELAAWAKKFPDEFYENIYKLRGWQWQGMTVNRYSVVAHYTNDLVYERMAPGLLKELQERSPKKNTGERPNKLHQWLNTDIGNPMLAQHLHTIINFQRLAIVNGYGWERFIKTIDQVMPRKGETLEMTLNDTLP